MKLRMNRGFTLIELLVVVAIVAILATIIMGNLNSARAKARDARRLSDLHQVLNALELYAVEHNGTYPAPYLDTYFWIDDNNYTGTTGFPPCGTTGGLQGYLASVCTYMDPQGSPYAYAAKSDGTPKLGAIFETTAHQGTAFTYGPSVIPRAGYYEPK